MAEVKNSIKFSTGGGNDIVVVANYSALPDPTTVSGEFYWCSASQGTKWLPGSLGGTFYNSGLYYSNGTTWEFLNVPYNATQSEVNAGLNNEKFVTALTLENFSKWSTKADKTEIPKSVILGSDVSTTSTSAVPTNLSLPIAVNANETYVAMVMMTTPSGGGKIEITGPSGSNVVGGQFSANSTSTTSRILQLALNTLSLAIITTTATSPIFIIFSVRNGSTAGDIKISFASVASSSTSINAGSKLTEIPNTTLTA